MKTFHKILALLSALACSGHQPAYALDAVPDDISAWTEQGVALAHGAPGTWDEKATLVKPVGMHKKDGVYYLHYLAGFEGCWDQHADVNHQSVGLATSVDGLHFTKYSGNPVLKPHDFVPVHSHEEGIRTASIRYLPDRGMWLGYFGVESPGGSDSCPHMGSTSQCACNVAVDASIFAATSLDGKNWTVKGEVSGVYNSVENYVDDFQYSNGQFYVWSHRAEGGQIHHASKGPDYMNLAPLGEIPKLCWGWSVLHTFLHDDAKTVTAIYDPGGGCAASDDNLYFATTSLNNMLAVPSERVVHSRGERDNFIFKDVDNNVWRWYYNVTSGSDAGTIHLRTYPLAGSGTADSVAPAPPASLAAQ